MKPEKIRAMLEKQKLEAKLGREQARANKARALFRPRKSDRGKIILVTPAGSRDALERGKAGYLVYVTLAGKKRVLRDFKARYKARKARQMDPVPRGNLKRAIAQFQASKLERLSSGKAVVRKQGGFDIASPGGNDFTEKVSNKLASVIRKTLEGQASHRSFLIELMVLVKLPDGTQTVVKVDVPIDRPDHIAIKLAGVKNFVRQKLYRYLALQLSYLGYVTSGSANHVRRLRENQDSEREDWTIGHKPWSGREKDTVTLQRIDWQIQQSK